MCWYFPLAMFWFKKVFEIGRRVYCPGWVYSLLTCPMKQPAHSTPTVVRCHHHFPAYHFHIPSQQTEVKDKTLEEYGK